jgi:hypothetical protein
MPNELYKPNNRVRGIRRSAAVINSTTGMAQATRIFLSVISGDACRVSLKELKSRNLLVAVYTKRKMSKAAIN